MGRKLTQDDVVMQLRQTVTDLREHLDQPLQAVDVIGKEAYVEQFARRQLGWGRLKGTYEAWKFVTDQAHWRPIDQACAHDAVANRINEVWAERAQTMTQQATAAGYRSHLRETLDLPATDTGEGERQLAARNQASLGHLDALQATSAALAGFPGRLQALPDIAHPERARHVTRDRGRNCERGQDRD